MPESYPKMSKSRWKQNASLWIARTTEQGRAPRPAAPAWKVRFAEPAAESSEIAGEPAAQFEREQELAAATAQTDHRPWQFQRPVKPNASCERASSISMQTDSSIESEFSECNLVSFGSKVPVFREHCPSVFPSVGPKTVTRKVYRLGRSFKKRPARTEWSLSNV